MYNIENWIVFDIDIEIIGILWVLYLRKSF